MKNTSYVVFSFFGTMARHDAMSRNHRQSYLKAQRLKAALTQADLAGLLGLTPNAISQYELGKRPVGRPTGRAYRSRNADLGNGRCR